MDKRNLELDILIWSILSNIEDFGVANKEFEYKIDQWKKFLKE